ncbi:hypothetical protein Q9Q99_03475 [Curtobacterium flaccumfaciens]|nr:hypothetical protein Q9Q99_03475 [Curtobacterium flaccumfaciens]
MNALGPVFAYLSRRLTFARPETTGAADVADPAVGAHPASPAAQAPAPERQPDQPVAASA